MSGFELNKIAGAILLATLIATLVGTIANILYKPTLKVQHRGYSIAVVESADEKEGKAPAEEQMPDIQALMKAANADAGKELSKKCLSCHGFDKGGPHKIGPNLWHVAGREKAKAEGYKYSSALSALGGIWDDESLFHMLHKPGKFVPGTKMTFAGLAKFEEIANVVAYLKTLHD